MTATATDQLAAARDQISSRWGRVDVLVDAAGGNVAAATLGDDGDIADLPEALRQVVDLNPLGTWLPREAYEPALTAAEPPDGAIPPIGMHMFALRNEARDDFEGALRRVAEIGYLGVEVDDLQGMEPAAFRKLTEELDLSARLRPTRHGVIRRSGTQRQECQNRR
jgi:hypothetical protein